MVGPLDARGRWAADINSHPRRPTKPLLYAAITPSNARRVFDGRFASISGSRRWRPLAVEAGNDVAGSAVRACTQASTHTLMLATLWRNLLPPTVSNGLQTPTDRPPASSAVARKAGYLRALAVCQLAHSAWIQPATTERLRLESCEQLSDSGMTRHDVGQYQR